MKGGAKLKSRVLILTDVMSFGGVEQVIVNTLNGIDYSKFDVTLFIMYKTEGEVVNISRLPSSVRLQYLFKRPPKGIYQRLLFYVLLLFPHSIISKVLIKDDYDVIVTTKDMFTYPVSACKCRKVMWIHSGLEYLEIEKPNILIMLKRWIQKLSYRKFDKIILLTEAARNRFCSRYNLREKSCILHNPINVDEVVKLSNESVLDYKFKDNINVICVCRLSIEKGVDRLINVCNKLLKEGYDFNLIILGDGPERKKIDKLIKENLILSNKVSVLGYKNNPYKYMSKCNIYVSPSVSEGFSLSIAEAMIMNLPILSTNCNGPSEILDNGKYGLLVENSEGGIYDGMKSLLSTPKLVNYYSDKSKERKEIFSDKKNIKLFERIIMGSK